MVDNAEWLAPLNYIEFLRDVGRHFSVNRMLTMDSAKLRLEREQELSFIEFNYMLLQAYDFVELAARTAASCRWAAPTSGATSSPASTSAAAGDGGSLRADLPAAHHRLGREDGQDRIRAPCGSTRTSSPPTTIGSTGATPRMPTSSAS